MPGLRRSNTRLLRVVGNKQHATDDDHIAETVKSKPKGSSSRSVETPSSVGSKKATHEAYDELEDYMRSPVSSEDEVEEIRPPPRVSDLQLLTSNSASVNGKKEHGTKGHSTKRKADDSDSDGPIFGSTAHSSQAKSQIRSSGSSDYTFKKPQGKRMTYGIQSSQPRSSQAEQAPKKTFKTAKALAVGLTPPRKQATFKVAGDASIFQFGAGSTEADTIDLSQSPSIGGNTSPSSPEILDCTQVGLTEDSEGGLKVQCEVCGQDVDLLLKQEYEDQFVQDGRFNMRRQEAFCNFHSRHDARQQWSEEGYPEIDWHGLDVRLKKQHARLKRIIERKTGSSFRTTLEQYMATRGDRDNGVAKDLETSTVGISAGYYGPRGQKVIMQHVVTNLAEALQKASRTDPLILAAGRGAGLSGYVQKVLVPEAALALIMEDQRVPEAQARDILSKSQRIGELLNEEEGDFKSSRNGQDIEVI